MARCKAMFDMLGPNPRQADIDGTHTCGLGQGHEPPHTCPRCGVRWVSEPGQRQNRVIPPGQAVNQ